MGLTEMVRGMAEQQKAEAEAARMKLTELFAAGSEFSKLGDLDGAIRTNGETAELLELIRSKNSIASKLTRGILPNLLHDLEELGLEEPSIEEAKGWLDQKTTKIQQERLLEEQGKRKPNVLNASQIQTIRVALRLTNNPTESVSMKDVIYEVYPAEELEDYQLAAGRVAGRIKCSLTKLGKILKPLEKMVLPLDSDQINALPLDDSVKQILHRASLIPAYKGLTMDEVINYCGFLNHKRANLLEPVKMDANQKESVSGEEDASRLTLDRKVYLATRLQRLQLASSNDRTMINSFLDLQEKRDVNLPDDERQGMYDEIMNYLNAETEVADSLWEQQDEGEQILTATLVRYLNQKDRPHTDEPWENLVADLLEVKRPEIISK